MTRASSRKNDSTSVTSPIDCQLPRSASLVTTAGLMSTQTVRTPAGSMLPVAMEWSIVDSRRAMRTPRGAHAVDGPHVVLMSVLDRETARDVHPKRGAEERGLDVVDGECIACEQDLHVTEFDQPREIDTRAGVHDRRPGDDQDPAARRAYLAHLGGNARDQHLLRLLGRDLAAHEAEDLRLSRALERRDPDALVADDHLHPGFRVLEDDAAGSLSLAVDRDGGIHLDVVDRDPATVQEDLRRQVARRVEAFWKDALA